MAVSRWLRPPRHLVVLFLGIALILVATLAWLGWRLFQQDRALERQRVRVRLEHAADVVAGELARRLDLIEGDLARLSTLPAADLPDAAERFSRAFSSDALVLVLTRYQLSAHPTGRLLYAPVTRPVPEPDAGVFAEGETLEYRRGDLAGAAAVYRRLAQSRESGIRAGALMRLARTERKAGHLAAALGVYDELAPLGAVPIGNLPAELVARHAALAVVEGLGRADELKRRAGELHADLQDGKWRLTRAQYEFHVAKVCRWTDCGRGADSTTVAARRALAAGAGWLWNRRGTGGGDGGELTWVDGSPILALWRSSAGRTVALVGGSKHLADDWIAALAPTLGRENVKAAFLDASGNRLTMPVRAEPNLVVTRTAAETRLPWTLQVASADPMADFAQLGERRRLMLLGLATLALLVAVGLYAVLRGVSRELAVARLQADFVAAVSHEFRTPLTSLRQMAELLSSGRVGSEERRARYYEIMERESGRLHRLVEGLLDFGRMEAGALEFSWERVMPADLVRRVVAEFEAEMGEGDHRIELAAESATPAVRADAEALSRALWNLLDNAVKYSPDQSTVRVRVSEDRGRVAIAVRDEGAGIPASEQAAVFGKFIRGTSSGGRGVKGTGIGLAMVKHIVEAHGGEVRLASEVGRGSTFTILLPVEE